MNLARSTSIIALMVPPVRPGHGVSVDVDRPQVPVRARDIDNYELPRHPRCAHPCLRERRDTACRSCGPRSRSRRASCPHSIARRPQVYLPCAPWLRARLCHRSYWRTPRLSPRCSLEVLLVPPWLQGDCFPYICQDCSGPRDFLLVTVHSTCRGIIPKLRFSECGATSRRIVIDFGNNAPWWVQAVIAPSPSSASSSASDGVSDPSAFLGLESGRSHTPRTSSLVTFARLVPLGNAV